MRFYQLKDFIKIIPYILQNIYFNFHYPSFSQACKLSIWLYKPHFGMLKGDIKILEEGKNWYDKIGLQSSCLVS